MGAVEEQEYQKIEMLKEFSCSPPVKACMNYRKRSHRWAICDTFLDGKLNKQFSFQKQCKKLDSRVVFHFVAAVQEHETF